MSNRFPLPDPSPEEMEELRGWYRMAKMRERDYWHERMERQSTLEQRIRAEEIIKERRINQERGEAPLRRS